MLPQDELEFEWDENQRWLNLAKFGIELLRGAELFDGGPATPIRRPSARKTVSSLSPDSMTGSSPWFGQSGVQP